MDGFVLYLGLGADVLLRSFGSLGDWGVGESGGLLGDVREVWETG